MARLSPFGEWRKALDNYLVKWYYANWDELAGDVEPLERAYDEGQSPKEFAEWYARKHDLIRRDRNEPY